MLVPLPPAGSRGFFHPMPFPSRSLFYFFTGEAKFVLCGPIGHGQARLWWNHTLQPMVVVVVRARGDPEPTVGHILGMSICVPTLTFVCPSSCPCVHPHVLVSTLTFMCPHVHTHLAFKDGSLMVLPESGREAPSQGWENASMGFLFFSSFL